MANSKCLTITYFGINSTCSLFSEKVIVERLQFVATNMNARVINLNKINDAAQLTFTQTYTAISQYAPWCGAPSAIEMGYLSSDSFIDMASVHLFSNQLIVWLGQGNGTFDQGTAYSTDAAPIDLSIVDLTNDGLLDFLVLCNAFNDILLFVNLGDGIFAAKGMVGSTAAFSSPFRMTLADLNNNGLVDVVIVCGNFPYVSVLLNQNYLNGSQFTLVPNNSLSFITLLPVAAVTADFNSDSLVDVAILTYFGNVFMYLGMGNGNFNYLATYTTSGLTEVSSCIVAFDVNNDGNIDLIVTNTGSMTVAVLFGDGQGAMSAPILYWVVGNPSYMRALDFEQVGHLDLLVLTGFNCYTLLTGDFNGIFKTSISCGYVPIGIVMKFAVGDINGDEIPDMAITATGTSNVQIFLGSFI
ncbi:unnamed protein product [Rotaria magnacalcarata]|uniref:VCBS repeat-containing protein n=1 Tax=Rotaria magnacalcarata TaxID=392030 RepID=A0A819KV02_9BILA|nr:unnamed protein product [Rotaria magnacalcarata]CAF3954963.1 unnamed protein product [Rotaria magnacalcarata]